MTSQQNIGHGWVRTRPDGAKAKCGGPGMCRECKAEQEALTSQEDAPPLTLDAWAELVAGGVLGTLPQTDAPVNLDERQSAAVTAAIIYQIKELWSIAP